MKFVHLLTAFIALVIVCAVFGFIAPWLISQDSDVAFAGGITIVVLVVFVFAAFVNHLIRKGTKK